jgi:alkanesulfonate monooxygenase SsuD/methylene tetrahydromethanopterin reductase-like flavin-dependent oxidoreductase (luciferase family)
MPDYGHPILIGSFITPSNARPEQVVALAQVSERAGLDLVTFQDHPYQAAFLDTWTLLSYVAARTERVRLAGNVLNLPLRQPAVLARSVASLDLLSGGRIELGLGAGAFWDAIEAMGGERLTAGEGVDALAEAIEIIRAIWEPEGGRGVYVEGEHHRAKGAKRGPAPAHPVEIWLGAYKPRMLALTGGTADGWLPSFGYLRPDPDAALRDGNARIDDAAAEAGRSPTEVRRLLNLGALSGDARADAERVARLALEHGVSTFIVGGDDPVELERVGAEVAPLLREIVHAGRLSAGRPATPVPVVRTAPGRVGRSRRISPARPMAALPADIDFGAIPGRLTDRTFTPRDAGYDDVRSTYMRAGHPGLIVMAESPDDVASAVELARRQPVELSVRSGGHGISRRSTNDGGVVIDVSQLDAIEVFDEASRRVRIGAGATWGHVAQTLGRHGWAMTSGNYGDVGVGGLATAGGIGYLVRRFGLTIDQVVAADIVLADGRLVRADADGDPDLLWAVRGAGGNVGIATAVELTALPVDRVVFASFAHDLGDAAGLLRGWADVMREAPRDLTSFLYLFPDGPSRSAVAQATHVWAGDDTETALPLLERLATVAPLVAQPRVQLVPYSAVVEPLDSRHTGQQHMRSRNGLLPRFEDGDADALARLIATPRIAMVEVRSLGGALADVDPGATAWAHRHQQVFVSAGGPGYAEEALDAAWSPVAARADGVYAAYTSDTRPERVHDAFPGETLRRLREIKRRVDPDNLFTGNVDVLAGGPIDARPAGRR